MTVVNFPSFFMSYISGTDIVTIVNIPKLDSIFLSLREPIL